MHTTTNYHRFLSVYAAWGEAGRNPQWLYLNGVYIVCGMRAKHFFINQFNKAA